MSASDHARLLLAILRRRWELVDELASGTTIDGATFVDLCLESDVPTWVHARLAEAGRLGLIGERAAGRLAEIRDRVRRDNLLLIARAEQALGALVACGVTPVALKGLDLLHRVYNGFDERTLDDVDLLVPPDQLQTSIDALVAQGWQLPPEPKRTHYIRTSHHLPIKSPGPVTVDFEIHWSLAQEMRYRIDQQALVARAVPLEIGGHRVLRMDDHDNVAHILLHHFTHYFDRRTKWALDLEAIARDPRFDWTVVVDRVRGWRATAAVGMSLRHLQKLFPEWIPRSVTDALPVAGWRSFLSWPLRSAHPLELFRATRRRWVQLYLAGLLLEKPSMLPRWLAHRSSRTAHTGTNPLDGP